MLCDHKIQNVALFRLPGPFTYVDVAGSHWRWRLRYCARTLIPARALLGDSRDRDGGWTRDKRAEVVMRLMSCQDDRGNPVIYWRWTSGVFAWTTFDTLEIPGGIASSMSHARPYHMHCSLQREATAVGAGFRELWENLQLQSATSLVHGAISCL